MAKLNPKFLSKRLALNHKYDKINFIFIKFEQFFIKKSAKCLSRTRISTKNKIKRLLELNIKSEKEKTMRALLKQKEIEYSFLEEQEKRERVEVQQLNQTIEYYKRLNLITVPILLACQNNQGAVHLTQEEWNTIIENTNACFNQFTQRLKGNFPSLTDEDIQFCCLVKMELYITLLSEIYHIAKGSISRRKMRLKEKMHIEDTTFDDFIIGF